MANKIKYKVFDYVNIEHHSYIDVEKKLNENFGEHGFELLLVIDMGENNTNKDGKSSRFRYIFKKMNKKLILKDLNNRDYCINDFERFKKHILEFHGSGSSIHEENGFYFRIDQKFRENLFKIKESK